MKKLRGSLMLVMSAGLLLLSCKKEKVELPQSNDPVFLVEGSFADEDFSLIAGDNGAYMYTMTEIINGVNFFKGVMSDGVTSVEVGVFDGNLDKPLHDPIGELGNIISAPQFAEFQTQNMVVFSKDMFANSAAIQQVKWFKDEQEIGINTASISEPGVYLVRAEVTFNDGTTVSLSNDVIVGYKRADNCKINFEIDVNDSVSLSLTGMTNYPQSVMWTFNGTFIGSGYALSYPLSAAGEIAADITFQDGTKRTKRIYVNPSNIFKMIEDFTMFEENQLNNIEQDFNFRIVIKKGGLEYSSYLADNSGSGIYISSIDYYGKNDNGKDVYKLTALINAKVRTAGSIKQIPVTFNTTFGIEIP